jgi:hypothetical protein
VLNSRVVILFYDRLGNLGKHSYIRLKTVMKTTRSFSLQIEMGSRDPPNNIRTVSQVSSNLISLNKCLQRSRQAERTELEQKNILRKAYMRKLKEIRKLKISHIKMRLVVRMSVRWESRNLPLRCFYVNDYNQNFFFNPGPSMTLIQPSQCG